MRSNASTVDLGTRARAGSCCWGSTTSRFATWSANTRATMPKPPARRDHAHTEPATRLARRPARRSSAAGSEDPAPLRYRQKNHRYKAVSGTAHGTLAKYRKFAAKRRFRGIVPASMISMPMSTARTIAPKPFLPVFMMRSTSLHGSWFQLHSQRRSAEALVDFQRTGPPEVSSPAGTSGGSRPPTGMYRSMDRRPPGLREWSMRETTFTELRNHAKTLFDAVEEGETVRVYRNGRPVADIVRIKTAMPAWKKPPQTRLSLGTLSLSDEVLADRDERPARSRDDFIVD
jgi:antitoxin (DNA-binding transcriptional repressor) of toxin-antitoxin stability system